MLEQPHGLFPANGVFFIENNLLKGTKWAFYQTKDWSSNQQKPENLEWNLITCLVQVRL